MRDLRRADLEPVAIVGAACRFPGAPSLRSFERLLAEGGDAVGHVTDDRWATQRYHHPDRGQKGKSYSFAAGLIGDVDRFDAAFFGISPREAAQTDPQQRLMLELAHEAVEDAGIDGAALAGTQVGVFVGGSSWDYLTRHTGDPSVMDAYSMTGATLCSLANRVSYALDLRGPSFTVDTACSSSLVALHQACEAIRIGQVPMAFVGGVNLLLAPHGFVGFSAASMLSPTGRCHAFDARADGYVRSEGGAMLILRPLRDALAAGDPIRAVIRGTGVNSDGRTAGFSLPSRAAQAELLRAVYARFEVDPDELCYVEAHGTGTPAGDPIEAGALGAALGLRRASPLPIGSVKTNIGHLEAASGMAGLLKAAFALRSGSVPRSLHCETPNPAIPFDALNLRIVPAELALPAGPRVAGVNSFGFGGANAHAILESPPEPRSDTRPEPRAGHAASPPLLLSARSAPALRALAGSWRDALGAEPPDEPADAPLLRGAARSREQHAHRLVVSGDTNGRLAGAIGRWLDGRGAHDAAAGEAVQGSVAFVFSGNGSQWAGMGRDAAARNPVFRDALAEVGEVLRPFIGWSVPERLGGFGADDMQDPAVAQPLLFAVQVAAVRALGEAGVRAEIHIGHSVGEVAAAWAASALDLEQACRVIAARSRLQSRTEGGGRMAVLGLPPASAAAALEGSGVEIAAFNASGAVTVAGPRAAVDALAERAGREGWAFSALDLSHAFHSAAMDPLEAPLLAELKRLSPPACPRAFVSTVAGGAMPAGARLDASYWWRNVRAPVRFAEAAAAAVAAGARILVEVGPQPVLQSYLADALRAADATGRVLPSLTRRAAPGRDPVAIAAARCHAAGCDIRGAPAFAGPARRTGLPAYPWQRERHWLGRTAESLDVVDLAAEHPLLGFRRDPAEPTEWSSHLGPSLQGFLADHVVGGATVAPAAVLLELALAAARARRPDAAVPEVLDFEIARPLVFEPGVLREVRLRVSAAWGEGGFEISSRPRLSEDPWVVHAAGRLSADDHAVSARPVPAAVAAAQAVRTEAAELYEGAARLGLEYGPAFRTVASVHVARDGSGADVALAPTQGSTQPPDGLLLPPTLMDGAFQGLVALASKLLPAGDGVLPWRFGRVRLLRPGASPASARVRVARVGPRSVRADIVLVDPEGRPVAEALDCWFVRVALSSSAAPWAGWLFHTARVESHDPRLAGTAGGMLAAALAGPGGPEPGGDAALLADAFASAAALDAIRAILPDAHEGFTPRGLAAAGTVAPDGRPVLDELLAWLEADGLAEESGGSWRLTGEDAPASDDVLRTLAYETPGSIADAALMAAAAEGLPAALTSGWPRDAPPASLLEQVLHASPSGRAAADALAAAVAAVARGWPAGGRPRVLEVGAGRGAFSRRLLRELHGAIRLDAAADPADLAALADALAGFPDARAVPWPGGRPPPGAGPYDLVVGYCALTSGAIAADEPAALLGLAPGGLLLLLEPEPSRAWTLAWPHAARRIQDGQAWRSALAGAGAAEADCRVVAGSWPASLVAARVAAPAQRRPEPGPTSVLADPDDALAGAVTAGLGAGAVRIAPEDAAAAFARWDRRPGSAPARLVVFPEAGGPAIAASWLDLVARSAAALPAGARMTVVTRGAGPAAAAFAGLRRVMANEMPDLDGRLVRLGADLTADAAAARALDEVLSPDEEAEASWDAGGRSVPRVRRGLPPPASPEAEPPALRLSVGRPGLLDTLGWDRAEPPGAPGPGELVLRVRAAGLNFRDVMWAMGLLPDEALLDGFAGPTLGLECAGEVIAAGEGAAGFAPGDRVMAFAPASLGTHVVTSAHAAMRMPPGMSFAAAATIPVAFLTVAYALGRLADLAAGERVLVHGGAGGVGLAAIQYARLRGACVIATAGTPAKRALLRRLGADQVLDSRGLGFADEVMRLTGGQGVDVVLNSLSGEAMERGIGLLRPFGRFLELGKRDFYGNTAIGLRPFRHNVSYFGVDADQLPSRRPALAAELLAEVAGLMADGALRPLPYRAYDAADAVQAFRLMQGAGHVGKIVLELGDGPAAPRARRQAAAPPAAAPVRPDRCYVVTGGLAGFGLETARWLAAQGARQLALLSRSGAAAPDAAAVLESFRAAGVDARAFACDVSDEAALASALAEIRAAAPIAGVIHAAAVMDDALLPDLDRARFLASLAPKLGGADALDRATRGDDLDLFVVFSSVTTVLGNPGQANYVAANAAAEAVAERRAAEGLPALCVQWGPIGDAGYLAREPGVARLLSRRLGGRLAGAAEMLAALPALLASGQAVAGLADIRWGALGAGLPLLRSAMFEDLRGGAAEPAAEVDLRELLASLPPDAAQARLVELLCGEVARIMRTSPSSIQPHRPLSEFGMDSLMAIELRLAMEQRFGLSVPVLSLSDGATLAALAGRMARAVAGEGAAAAAPDEAARTAGRIARFEPDYAAPAPAEPSFADAAEP